MSDSLGSAIDELERRVRRAPQPVGAAELSVPVAGRSTAVEQAKEPPPLGSAP